MPTKPLLEVTANYVKRAADQFPRQGTGGPWSVSMSYLTDAKRLRAGEVGDPNLRFATSVEPIDGLAIEATAANPVAV